MWPKLARSNLVRHKLVRHKLVRHKLVPNKLARHTSVPHKLALHKLWCSAARYISAWWRLEDRRGRAAAYEQRLYELENLRRRKLVYLREKIKTFYGYDPECDDPDRIAHHLDAEAQAHLLLHNPKQLAVVADYHQLKEITDVIGSFPIASPQRSEVRFDPSIADYYGKVH